MEVNMGVTIATGTGAEAKITQYFYRLGTGEGEQSIEEVMEKLRLILSEATRHGR